MLYRALRPLLFGIDPERVHEIAMSALAAVEALPPATPFSPTPLVRNLWGLHFPNPIGLAAGFDKNARLPHVWPRFGFGFAELGTVTALPQPGNPKPRLFRLAEHHALINRLGFNNEGANAVARRLAQSLRRPATVPLGINIGKSAVVDLADAAEDYASSYRQLAPFADYVTVNVSSPNTKGLRDLQAVESLSPIVGAIRGVELPQGRAHPPLLIKLAPDLDDGALRELVDFALERDIDGLIATNTTIGRPGIVNQTETGGLSGRPLAQRSNEVIRLLRRHSDARIPIVGVGGVFDPDDAFAKIQAGADLVQMYTGFVYGGPSAPRRVATGLARRLEAGGFASIADAVGSTCG